MIWGQPRRVISAALSLPLVSIHLHLAPFPLGPVVSLPHRPTLPRGMAPQGVWGSEVPPQHARKPQPGPFAGQQNGVTYRAP